MFVLWDCHSNKDPNFGRITILQGKRILSQSIESVGQYKDPGLITNSDLSRGRVLSGDSGHQTPTVLKTDGVC